MKEVARKGGRSGGVEVEKKKGRKKREKLGTLFDRNSSGHSKTKRKSSRHRTRTHAPILVLNSMQTLRAMSHGMVSAAAAARSPQARVTAPRSRRALSSPRLSPMMQATANDGGSVNQGTWTSPADTPPDPNAAASASRALRLVDEAMDLLHRELFVSEAIARATGEEPEDESSVVARVVEALASGKSGSSEESFEDRKAGEEDDDVLELLGLSSSTSSSSSSPNQQQPRQLDEAFLVALGIAAAAATSPPPESEEGETKKKKKRNPEDDSKAREIARRLLLLREATVSRASASLPAELRALDAAARAGSAGERRAVVREALVGRGRGSEVPPPSPSSAPPPLQRVSPAAFYSASCQVIDDMEQRQIIPDAALLARVVLCRDDALAMQRNGNDSESSVSGGSGSGGSCGDSEREVGNHESAFADSPEEDADLRDAVSSHGAMLHRGGAEFAGMLVSMCKTGEERRELVKKIMRRGDVLAWQGHEKDMSSIPTLAKAKAAPRPGRLFAALYATRDALAARGDSQRAKALERARRDAVEVMEEIAYGPTKTS
jgi:hypothetical protein